MPMNPEYKAPWLTALRSGDYRQARGKLYDGAGYCCLGVLCKVAGSQFYQVNEDEGSEDDEGNFHPDEPSYQPSAVGGDVPGDDGILTNHGLSVFGLSSEIAETLAAMNDGKPVWTTPAGTTPAVPPKSFAEIADWIEENL